MLIALQAIKGQVATHVSYGDTKGKHRPESNKGLSNLWMSANPPPI
jgi:hypothetical protein